MDTISRLVCAGMAPTCAIETVAWFRQQGEDHLLERYIQNVEEKHNELCAV